MNLGLLPLCMPFELEQGEPAIVYLDTCRKKGLFREEHLELVTRTFSELF